MRVFRNAIGDKRKRTVFTVILASLLLVWNGGLTAHAEAGVPYVTNVAALKADLPGQKLVVKVKDHTFERTMADFGSMEVVVQDNADGTRLCHIPDTAALDAFVEEINNVLASEPEGDAFYYYDVETDTFLTWPGVSFAQISDAGKEQICYKLLEMLAFPGAEDAIIEIGEPHLQVENAEVPEEVVINKYSLEGSCTTSFRGSSSNRIKNIQVAASNINQMVLYPGQEASMNTAFRPRTSANGYRQAGTYVGGKVVPGMGGGICQVSSTVYNAVMNSGLTVLERHPHSMPVHYLPLGMDAAISGGSKDLRFRNDYPFPVLIEAYTEGKNLTVNIYTNELLTAGTSYRLHAVRKGSLAANAYLEISSDGAVVEDRFLGTSRYSPMLPDNEEEED